MCSTLFQERLRNGISSKDVQFDVNNIATIQFLILKMFHDEVFRKKI